ncbi:MAG TPA: hypothetical protein VLJ68_12165 [Chitinophagaceae bacterium]|nr:hypothetical protein [Chitinophagaceae bacterium]
MENVKEVVRQKYSEIALQDKETNQASCCGATSVCCGGDNSAIMADDYSKIEGTLPEKWKKVAELYVGCVSGAIERKNYLDIIKEAGFTNITLQKEKNIILPDDVLSTYLSPDEITEYKNSNTGIQSITVYAEKPAKDDRNCCEPGSGCC